MAYPVNKELTEMKRTLETRILDAVWDDNDSKIKSLMCEAELLFKNNLLSDRDYSFLTDIETIKEIYS